MCLEAKKQKGKNNWFLMQKCNNNVSMRSLLEAEINKSWRMRLKIVNHQERCTVDEFSS